jgi:hypothetical protein
MQTALAAAKVRPHIETGCLRELEFKSLSPF